jgi:hypothetical protein
MQNSYRHLVVDLRVERTTSQSRILVKGKVVPNKIPENPDVCPLDCKKKRDLRLKRDLRFIEPQRTLLTRHQNIGLFYCDGCPHLLFKSLIVPTPFRAQKLNMHLNEESASGQSHIPIEISSTEKITPLIITSMEVDNEKTGVLEHGGFNPTAMNGDFKLLTERMNKTLHTRGFALICLRCNEPIEVGTLYHRSGLSRKTKKFYHKECWEALLN